MDEDDRILAYLQNRLDAADRAAFEADMAARPDLRAQVAALRAAAAELGRQPVPEGARAAGWDRLSAAIDAERMPEPANTNARFVLLKVAALIVGSVCVWQFAVAPRLPGLPGGFTPASVAAEGPALRLAFDDTALAADITALLQEAGATVIDGPGALGLYTVAFASDSERNAAEVLFADRGDLIVMVTRP